jgi:uncharacterized protein (DUF1330 family)
MSVYMLVEAKVRDGKVYAAYVDQVAATVKQYGGRYLVRGGNVTPLAGGWNPERIISMEFPSAERIREWLASPEYQRLAPLCQAGAETRAVVLEGYTA